MKRKLILCFLGTVLLAGCSINNGPHGGHTTKWYEKHTAARRVENHWCESQSMSTQMHSKSCARSIGASFEIQQHLENEQTDQVAASVLSADAAAKSSASQADAAMLSNRLPLN
ncbi:MAG: hypothetical protein ACYCS8_11490 [Acidithiobacillus sp.]